MSIMSKKKIKYNDKKKREREYIYIYIGKINFDISVRKASVLHTTISLISASLTFVEKKLKYLYYFTINVLYLHISI
jgi:hypothetical protein